jgi:hypothetical protein
MGRRRAAAGPALSRHSFLLSNEALDWNKPGVLVRLQGWAMVEVGKAGVLKALEETRILKRRRVR